MREAGLSRLRPYRGQAGVGVMFRESKTVKELLKEYLRKNDYDGLWGEECCCDIDELCLCCESSEVLECRPGVKKPCDCGEGCRFHIGYKVSELCAKTNVQNCHCCEKKECGDNQNPEILRKMNEEGKKDV